MADTSTGWVKIYRSIVDWEYFDDAEMVKFLIYLIVKVNHEDSNWHGIVIYRGQTVTSYRKLSSDLGVGIATIDRMLKKMEISGTAERKRNAKFTIITLKKYCEFQNSGTKSEQSQNDSGTKAESNKNDKNDKKKESIMPAAKTDTPTGKRLERRF